MVSLILASSLLAQTSLQTTKLVTLPNGARIYCETIKGSSRCSVQLFASSKGVVDTTGTLGWRHLLEHLAAKSPSGDLDQRLEQHGLVLLADTTREMMTFSIDCPAEQSEFAIRNLVEVLQPISITAEALAREKLILGHEIALRSTPGWRSARVWRDFMGDSWLDPMGTTSSIATATVDDILRLQKAHFAPNQLIFVVTGGINLDKTVEACKLAIGSLPNVKTATFDAGKAVDPVFPSVTCASVSIRAGSLLDPTTCAKFGVGLALSQNITGTEFIYSPSFHESVMTIYSPDDRLSAQIKDLVPGNVRAAKALASGWFESAMNSPSELGRLRALSLFSDPPINLEQVREAIDRMDSTSITAALDSWKGK